jgi:GT2 family glycosyltransferase
VHRITRIWHDEPEEADGDAPERASSARAASPGEPLATRDARDASSVHHAGHAGHLPYVTIVVVARAGQASLRQCLEALAAQTYPPGRMEVIVVGDARDRSVTTAVASLARQRPGLRLRYTPSPAPGGVAAARNRGWRHARGELIGFTLDSVIPSTEWVAAAANCFNPAVDVIGGQVVVPLPARPPAAVREVVEHVQRPWSAANVFYRRSLLDRLAGFDERFAAGMHDDVDLAMAAIRAGARFHTAERAVVVHERPATDRFAMLRRQSAHLSEALLYRKHPQLYPRYVRRRPPLGHYAASGLLLAALTGLLARRQGLARGSGLAWLALTLGGFARGARDTSDHPRDLLDLLLATALVPPVAVGYRLAGAIRHRVWFF